MKTLDVIETLDEIVNKKEDKKIEKLVGEDKGTYIDYSACDIVDKVNEIIEVINERRL